MIINKDAMAKHFGGYTLHDISQALMLNPTSTAKIVIKALGYKKKGFSKYDVKEIKKIKDFKDELDLKVNQEIKKSVQKDLTRMKEEEVKRLKDRIKICRKCKYWFKKKVGNFGRCMKSDQTLYTSFDAECDGIN